MSNILNNQFNYRNSNIKPYSLIGRQNNFQKSIIAQLPQSVDLGQKLKQKDSQIQRLTHALQFYRNNQKNTHKSINPFDFYLTTDKKPTNSINSNYKLEQAQFDIQIKQWIQNASKAASLKKQNDLLKQQIKFMQMQIIQLKQIKSADNDTQKSINKRMKDSQSQINKLKSQIWSLQTQINKITYENTQLKKALNSVTKLKIGQQSQSVLKIIQQSSDLKGQSLSSILQNKLSQLKQQYELKSNQCQNLKSKNIQLEAQLFKMTNEIQQKNKKIKNIEMNLSPSKRQQKFNNRQSLSSQKKINILSSITELQMIDVDRYQLKIMQKTKQYEQLYSKYQKIQSQKIALQDINQQLQRQRKFLADRLSQIQILQQGDEVVGQMQNKLVLMSTQLMRLGHLNRTKLQQNKQLNIKTKQMINKIQMLTKDCIEKDKIILDYKEQINMIEQKVLQKSLLDQVDQQTLQQYKQELLQKDKQIQRLSYLNKQRQEDIKTLQLKIKIFQQKIHRLEQENRQLQKQLKQLGKNAMAQSTTKYFNLQLQLERYKNNNVSLQNQLKVLHSKITVLRSQCHQLQLQKSSFSNQKHIYEQKIHFLQSKLKKNDFRVEQKDQQIKNLKHQYEQKMISKNDQIRKIQQKIIIMQKNAQSLMKSPKKGFNQQNLLQNYHKIQQQNMLLKIDISKYQQKMALLTQQIQRLNFMINKISSQNQNLSTIKQDTRQKEKQLRQLKRQIESLTNKNKRVQQQKKMYENKVKQMTEQFKQFQFYQGQYRRMKNQYEVTKSQLQIKDQQYNSVLRRIQNQASSVKSPRSFYNQQLQQKVQLYERKIKTLSEQFQIKYSAEIDRLKRQNQSYKITINNLQDTQAEYALQQLSQQIIRLNQVLGQRTEEILRNQKQIQLYHHKLIKCEEMLVQQRNSKIKQLGSFISNNSLIDIQRHNSTIRNQQKQIILLNQRIQNLKVSNRNMQQKLDTLVTQKIKLQHKISQLQYSKGQKSRIYHQNQNYLNNLITQIRVSNQRLQSSIKQIEEHYIQRVQQKQEEIRKLQRDFRNQKSQLEKRVLEKDSQIRRLRTQIQEKQNILYQNHHSSLIQQSQHQNIIKIKEDYQIKLALLSQEVQRCVILKDQKIEELKNLKSRYQKIQQEKKDLIIQNQCNNNKVQLFSNQISRLNSVLADFIQKLKEKDRQNAKIKLQFQQNLVEINRLRQSQHQKSPQSKKFIPYTEFQDLNQQFVHIKSNLQSEQFNSQALSQNIKQLQNRCENQRSQFIELQQQNNKLIRQKKNLIQQKDNLETKLRQVKRSQQHTRQLLNQQLRKKQIVESQIIELRRTIQQNEYRLRQQSPLKNLTQQIRILRQDNKRLQQNLKLIVSQNQKLVFQVQSFKRSKSNSLSSSAHKNQKDSLEQSNQLRSQNQLLNRQIKQLQKRIIQNNKYRGQVQSYEQEIQDFKHKITRINKQKKQAYDELSKLQQEFKQKCQQIRKVTQRNNQIQDQLHNLRSKFEKVTKQITILTKEKKDLTEKIQNYKHQSSQQSSKNKSQYYTKKIEMTTIDQVDQKQQRSRGPSAHQGINQNNQSYFQQLKQKYQLMDSINSKLKKQNQCYRKKGIQYEFKMNKLKQEFDLLSKLINQYRDQNQQLKKANYAGKQYFNDQKTQIFTKSQQNTHISNEHIISQNIPHQNNLQHYYSQTRINNGPFNIIPGQRSQSPQPFINRKIIEKSGTNVNGHMGVSKTESTITFKGSHMNMNEYNNLKQSMHHYQNQLSQTTINNKGIVNPMVTLPIDQIHMLINQIQRLFAENKSLIQQLNDSKVMIIKYQSNKSRSEQNLATMVLMIVEIQALRHRVAVAQAQRQKLRRESFSPTKSNR